MENIKFYDHKTGAILEENPQHNVEQLFGAPFWQIHRADLHQVLLEKARDVGMTVMMGQHVKEYEWDTSTGPKAILGNGDNVEADVIICADGMYVFLFSPFSAFQYVDPYTCPVGWRPMKQMFSRFS